MLPAGAHVVGKTGPRVAGARNGNYIVDKTGPRVAEARNGKLRPRCGVLVRRSRPFSKCRGNYHNNRIKIAIDQHNLEITLD